MKPAKKKSEYARILPFNWTKVELKLVAGMNYAEYVEAFNWTKVELKLYWMAAA